jgi:predicted DNA-binding transcriptional regulator YafY
MATPPAARRDRQVVRLLGLLYVKEREWHPSQQIKDLRDGRVELAFTAGGEFEIIRWILGWGDAAEVVRPRRVRERVQSALRHALSRYAE